MRDFFLTLFFLLIFSYSYAKKSWIGKWMALDEWQSEFTIEINEDGSALSDYANGDKGTWKLVDGNVVIMWDSGKKDYIFNGVMGFQRLNKGKKKSYTSGMKKLLD